MDRKKYSLGLSSFPLLHNEIIIAARVFSGLGDWKLTKAKLIDENLLQRTRLSTRKVAVNETLKRLKHANDWELEVLIKSDDLQDQKFICLLLISRQYELLLHTVSDFLLYKVSGGDFALESGEIANWFEKLGESHEEIANLKPGSFRRLVNNTRIILSNGGLLQGDAPHQRIIYPGITFNLRSRYETDGSINDLIMMLKTDREIRQIMETR